MRFRPSKIVWHGSDGKGEVKNMHTCSNWRTPNFAVTGQAANLVSGLLLEQRTFSCTNSLIVLCIENSASTWAYRR